MSFDFSAAYALGAPDIRPNAVAVDAAGNTYISGTFAGTVNFDPTGAQGTRFQRASNGGFDIFVAAYTPSGTPLWVNTYGNVGSDRGESIAVDNAGHVYASGFFSGGVNFNPAGGGGNLNAPGYGAVFVLSLNAADGSFRYASQVQAAANSNNFDQGGALAVDGAGDAYVAGVFTGQATFGGASLTATGSQDVFVTKLNPSGAFVWASSAPGSAGSNDFAFGVAAQPDGNVVVVGSFAGTADFGTAPLTSAGSQDAFVWELNGANGAPIGAQRYGGTGNDEMAGVAVDGANNIYVSGFYQGSIALGSRTLVSGQANGQFAMRLDPSGASIQWATPLGSSGSQYSFGPYPGQSGGMGGIAYNGQLYVSGSFQGTANLGNGNVLTARGADDVYVAQLDPGTGAVLQAGEAGGAGADLGYAMAVPPTAPPGHGGATLIGTYSPPATFGRTTLGAVGSGNSVSMFVANAFAATGTRFVHGDYDGDGKADFTVFRPSTAYYYSLLTGGGVIAQQFGAAGDIPMTTDYTGNGKDDITIYRPSNSTIYSLLSGGGAIVHQFGGAGDIPLTGDFFGDGKDDLAVYDPINGVFYALELNSAGQPVNALAQQLGGPGFIPVPADYFGDGKADPAVFLPSTATFYVLHENAAGRADNALVQQFGAAGDIPVPADYGGTGVADWAVFRPSTATWYALVRSSGGAITGAIAQQFGGSGDIPLTSPLQYRGQGEISIASAYRVSAASFGADAPAATVSPGAFLSIVPGAQPTKHRNASASASAFDELSARGEINLG